jgi:DNA repair protein RadC
MRRIRETPPCDRPREKLYKNGPTYLTDVELVVLLLGSGVKGFDVFAIAEEVREFLEENVLLLKKDFSAFMQGLTRIRGLGRAKAALFAACCELCSRLHSKKTQTIKNACDIYPFLSYLSSKRQEHFVCVHLNGANRVVSSKTVTIGLVDQALVHPREVFSDAVKEKASKIIVAHNHPAGGLLPSNEDISVTRNLSRAGELLGIALLDHLIIGDDGYFSFKEEGLL